MDENISLRDITRDWVNGVREYYKDTDNLTQVFARGYFAGMSEREVKEFADKLYETNRLCEMRESREKHPLNSKEEAEKQVNEFDKVQPIHSGSKCPDCEGVIDKKK